MSGDETSRRLAEAESNVARALLRLQRIRRAILNGEFDPQAYDEALHAYRQAEHEAYDARQAWARARNAMPAMPAPPAPPAPVPALPDASGDSAAAAAAPSPAAAAPPAASGTDAPFEPSERMRFVRWLVQQGRLSEWNVE
jgi:hypothetical protein